MATAYSAGHIVVVLPESAWIQSSKWYSNEWHKLKKQSMEELQVTEAFIWLPALYQIQRHW